MSESTTKTGGANDGQYASRIASLETRSVSQEKDFRDLVERVDRGFHDISASIVALREHISSGQRTPWGVLATWAGVVITVILSTGWVVLAFGDQRFASSEKESARIESQLDRHETLIWRWHEKMGEIFARLERNSK